MAKTRRSSAADDTENPKVTRLIPGGTLGAGLPRVNPAPGRPGELPLVEGGRTITQGYPVGTFTREIEEARRARDAQAPQQYQATIISQVHPRWSEWAPVWRELGWVYEGDGPYLTGDALVPHTRELLYGVNDGVTDFNNPIGVKRKFLQRKKLARYENFACTLTDLFVDYQYAQTPTRRVENVPGSLDRSTYEDWLEDVDGFGTHIDDWLKRYQTLTNVFGHQVVVMDRLAPTNRTYSITPNGSRTQLTTLADLGRPVLRCYAPLDMLDWLAPQNQLAAVKISEPIERPNLVTQVTPADRRYIVWDPQFFYSYDASGVQLRTGPHGYGELPARVWYAKRRAKIPIIGRSLLRDHTLFKDHYNLISEMRELFRAQVFSMLHIQLGAEETVKEARDRLGDHAGTDALVFSKGGADYIAPPDGPVTMYAAEISAVERKVFRLANLPWESDSRDAESEGSRKLKAADLNAALASLADNAQEIDYWVAKMYFQATLGPQRGRAAFEDAGVRIKHPDDFNTQQLTTAAADALVVTQLGVGPTATRLIKASVINIALPDLDADSKADINKELEAEAARAEEAKQKEHDNLVSGFNPREEADRTREDADANHQRETQRTREQADREDARAEADRQHQIVLERERAKLQRRAGASPSARQKAKKA